MSDGMLTWCAAVTKFNDKTKRYDDVRKCFLTSTCEVANDHWLGIQQVINQLLVLRTPVKQSAWREQCASAATTEILCSKERARYPTFPNKPDASPIMYSMRLGC